MRVGLIGPIKEEVEVFTSIVGLMVYFFDGNVDSGLYSSEGRRHYG
jgi:hypothetical protein